ncbi:hypothetical protein BH11ARM2_BH11ARM2_13710 [soil metagenome]
MKHYQSHYYPATIELTDERAAHIAQRHPDLYPQEEARLELTLAEPDGVVRRVTREGNPKHEFYRWFPDLRGGKFVRVQVVTDSGDPDRHWIVTAYLATSPPHDR